MRYIYNVKLRHLEYWNITQRFLSLHRNLLNAGFHRQRSQGLLKWPLYPKCPEQSILLKRKNYHKNRKKQIKIIINKIRALNQFMIKELDDEHFLTQILVLGCLGYGLNKIGWIQTFARYKYRMELGRQHTQSKLRGQVI